MHKNPSTHQIIFTTENDRSTAPFASLSRSPTSSTHPLCLFTRPEASRRFVWAFDSSTLMQTFERKKSIFYPFVPVRHRRRLGWCGMRQGNGIERSHQVVGVVVVVGRFGVRLFGSYFMPVMQPRPSCRRKEARIQRANQKSGQ